MRTRKNDRAAPNEEIWQGALDVGSAKLRLAPRLTQSADGKPTGKLDSPDQRAMELPIDTITHQDQSLRFEMNLSSHPCLSATIGSTFVARRAGTSAASSATTINRTVTVMNVSGSVALTP
jgi:hypothetical protein